jgi:hypothetical protein
MIKENKIKQQILKILHLLIVVLVTKAQTNQHQIQSIDYEKFNDIASQSIEDKKIVYNQAKSILKKSSITPQDALEQAYLLNPEISHRASSRLAVAIFTHYGKDKTFDDIIENIIKHLDVEKRKIFKKIIERKVDDLHDKDDILKKVAYLKTKVTCKHEKSYHENATNHWANWTNKYKDLTPKQQKECIEQYLTKALNFALEYPNFTVKALKKYKLTQVFGDLMLRLS